MNHPFLFYCRSYLLLYTPVYYYQQIRLFFCNPLTIFNDVVFFNFLYVVCREVSNCVVPYLYVSYLFIYLLFFFY